MSVVLPPRDLFEFVVVEQFVFSGGNLKLRCRDFVAEFISRTRFNFSFTQIFVGKGDSICDGTESFSKVFVGFNIAHETFEFVHDIHHLNIFFAAVDCFDFVGAVGQVDRNCAPVVAAGILGYDFNSVAAKNLLASFSVAGADLHNVACI